MLVDRRLGRNAHVLGDAHCLALSLYRKCGLHHVPCGLYFRPLAFLPPVVVVLSVERPFEIDRDRWYPLLVMAEMFACSVASRAATVSATDSIISSTLVNSFLFSLLFDSYKFIRVSVITEIALETFELSFPKNLSNTTLYLMSSPAAAVSRRKNADGLSLDRCSILSRTILIFSVGVSENLFMRLFFNLL